MNFSLECSFGEPKRAISQAKAPRPTPKTNLPSVNISATATSPANVRISWRGKTHTLVTMFIFEHPPRNIFNWKISLKTSLCSAYLGRCKRLCISLSWSKSSSSSVTRMQNRACAVLKSSYTAAANPVEAQPFAIQFYDLTTYAITYLNKSRFSCSSSTFQNCNKGFFVFNCIYDILKQHLHLFG